MRDLYDYTVETEAGTFNVTLEKVYDQLELHETQDVNGNGVDLSFLMMSHNGEFITFEKYVVDRAIRMYQEDRE